MSQPSKSRRSAILASAAAGLGLAPVAEGATATPVRVVYHVTQGLPQASRCLGNVRNHLAADPGVKIVVVGNGAGIDFMLEGAVDGNGAAYAGNIGDLANQGVVFKACQNTLTFMKIPSSDVVLEATLVRAGVYEVVRLQAQGWFYIKP